MPEDLKDLAIVRLLHYNSQTLVKSISDKIPHKDKAITEFDATKYHLKSNPLHKYPMSLKWQAVGEICNVEECWIFDLLNASEPARYFFQYILLNIDKRTNIVKHDIEDLTKSQKAARHKAIRELITLRLIKRCNNKNLLVNPTVIIPLPKYFSNVYATWNTF